MNAAYLKVTHGLCFHLYLCNNFVFILFFSWLRIADVHQLWSFAFSRKHEERAVADAGMVHVTFFFFWATGMVPPWKLVPYANCVTDHTCNKLFAVKQKKQTT